ncbi:hypothetical protein [Klebsiella michiganensis]|uniref:hypothetical protein n=1 Tax=Klebsiella michiganensis TaxID=1134687 RepID=UPI003F509FBE
MFTDNCWTGVGVAALLRDAGWPQSEIHRLAPLTGCGDVVLPVAPVPVVCELPESLGALMATLEGLMLALTLSLPRSPRYVVLLTGAPARWVRETLIPVAGGSPGWTIVRVLPVDCRTGQLQRAFSTRSVATRERGRSLQALSLPEVGVLADLMFRRQVPAEIARQRGMSEVKVQHLLERALQRVGVRTPRQLMLWRGERM